MANELAALSNELAAAVEAVGKSVVAVHARPRFSSSGVFWRAGVIVTAEHAIRREEEIQVTLPDGQECGGDAGRERCGVGPRGAEGRRGGAPVRDGAAGARAGKPGAGDRDASEDSGVNATLGIVSAVSRRWRTWRGGRLDPISGWI